MRIGVDLGGTNIAAGIVLADGRILAKNSVTFRRGGGEAGLISDVAGLCNGLLVDNNILPGQIEALGIGCPGSVDPQRGVILRAYNLGLENVSVSHLLGRVLMLPIHVANDANCAALGEATFGAARGSKFSITITLGTGVGGGLIFNGRIYTGPFFAAGEMHQVIRAGGEACACGRRGCWEAYVSAGALTRVAIGLGGGNDVTAKMVFEAADAGVNWAIQATEEYYDNLAIGLGNLVNILQPEVIVIGGGISGRGQGLIDAVNKRMAAETFGDDLRTKFVIADLGNDAGIIGAALLP